MYRLNDNNGIIHHHTNREHQRKERKQVDTESEQIEEHKCSHDRDDGCDKRNKCRAQRTQEYKYHQRNEQNSLQQRTDYILNRSVEEVVSTRKHNHLQVCREVLLRLCQILVNTIDNLRSIRARGLIYIERCTRTAVNLSYVEVRLCTQLDIGNILQTQHLTIRQRTDYDISKLLSLLQATLIAHRILECLVRVFTQSSRCSLDILFAQGR